MLHLRRFFLIVTMFLLGYVACRDEGWFGFGNGGGEIAGSQPLEGWIGSVDGEQVLSGLPAAPGAGSVAWVTESNQILLDFVSYLWADAALFAGLYLSIRQRRRDPVLHVALCLAVSLPAIAAVCLASWLLGARWRAPWPEVAALSAIVLGLGGAWFTYTPARRSRQAV